MNTYQEELHDLLNRVEETNAALISIRKWAKDRGVVLSMPTTKQVRVIIDSYYTTQEMRKRLTNQISAAEDAEEPCDILEWLNKQDSNLEMWIKLSLSYFVAQHKMGPWLTGVYGIGPILAAGLLAHIHMGYWCETCHGRDEEDCTRRQQDKKFKIAAHTYHAIRSCPTVGHIWQYCGLAGDGQREWKTKTRRPWNAFLKSLCAYKIGDSFIKFHNHPSCVYGHLYAQRKALEVSRNDSGAFAAQALVEAPRKSKDSEAWPWNNGCYPGGTTALTLELKTVKERSDFLASVRGEPGSGTAMLHLDHINSRARRYAVKQFLSDFHLAWYHAEFGEEPPLPYPIAILGHAHHRQPL